ncbi:hypothetical protein [Caproiciproducens faecalis]|uniref:Lipoprotein n=1 Tax=Caproiciproducens faecalis TaxID=2820301 RepID=A0ABS7DNK6_9FIRM|nr:hypothetical protein [Caproiciproducens faecalis]MBW7572895.1 hypothetical protein [Caproiciproducens faecalis]
MKKILILALAVVMAGSLAACGMGDVGGAQSAPSASSQTVSSAVGSDNMADNLDGLEKYLTANSAISGTPTEMKADFIGAEKGAKYQFAYNGKNNVTVELYEFNTDSLSSEASAVLDEVKANSRFTIMNQTVPAVISDSGKYIMIYKDTVDSDQNKQHQDEATKLFKEFKK